LARAVLNFLTQTAAYTLPASFFFIFSIFVFSEGCVLNLLLQRVKTKAGEEQLKTLIEQHVAATGSAKAKRILDNWSQDA
jgi:glutamate synthase domain-containing protein 3